MHHLDPRPREKEMCLRHGHPCPCPRQRPSPHPSPRPLPSPSPRPASAIDVVILERWGDGALSGPLAATIAKKQAEYEEKYGSGWLTKPP